MNTGKLAVSPNADSVHLTAAAPCLGVPSRRAYVCLPSGFSSDVHSTPLVIMAPTGSSQTPPQQDGLVNCGHVIEYSSDDEQTVCVYNQVSEHML